MRGRHTSRTRRRSSHTRAFLRDDNRACCSCRRGHAKIDALNRHRHNVSHYCAPKGKDARGRDRSSEGLKVHGFAAAILTCRRFYAHRQKRDLLGLARSPDRLRAYTDGRLHACLWAILRARENRHTRDLLDLSRSPDRLRAYGDGRLRARHGHLPSFGEGGPRRDRAMGVPGGLLCVLLRPATMLHGIHKFPCYQILTKRSENQARVNIYHTLYGPRHGTTSMVTFGAICVTFSISGGIKSSTARSGIISRKCRSLLAASKSSDMNSPRTWSSACASGARASLAPVASAPSARPIAPAGDRRSDRAAAAAHGWSPAATARSATRRGWLPAAAPPAPPAG